MSATGCYANYRGYNKICYTERTIIKGNRCKNLLPFCLKNILLLFLHTAIPALE